MPNQSSRLCACRYISNEVFDKRKSICRFWYFSSYSTESDRERDRTKIDNQEVGQKDSSQSKHVWYQDLWLKGRMSNETVARVWRVGEFRDSLDWLRRIPLNYYSDVWFSHKPQAKKLKNVCTHTYTHKHIYLYTFYYFVYQHTWEWTLNFVSQFLISRQDQYFTTVMVFVLQNLCACVMKFANCFTQNYRKFVQWSWKQLYGL